MFAIPTWFLLVISNNKLLIPLFLEFCMCVFQPLTLSYFQRSHKVSICFRRTIWIRCNKSNVCLVPENRFCKIQQTSCCILFRVNCLCTKAKTVILRIRLCGQPFSLEFGKLCISCCVLFFLPHRIKITRRTN